MLEDSGKLYTLPKTNSQFAPENRPKRPKRKPDRLPTIHFEVHTLTLIGPGKHIPSSILMTNQGATVSVEAKTEAKIKRLCAGNWKGVPLGLGILKDWKNPLEGGEEMNGLSLEFQDFGPGNCQWSCLVLFCLEFYYFYHILPNTSWALIFWDTFLGRSWGPKSYFPTCALGRFLKKKGFASVLEQTWTNSFRFKFIQLKKSC